MNILILTIFTNNIQGDKKCYLPVKMLIFPWNYSIIIHTVTKSRKTSTQKNKMLLIKNPQFLPNQADILPSEFVQWMDILTKFHNNWTKIVDFLVIAFYFPERTFFWIWSQCGRVGECLSFEKKNHRTL